jgi:DNA polymerase (family 10)
MAAQTSARIIDRSVTCMPVHNAEIASLFERYALLLEIEGANPFRVRAYRNAARTVQGLPRSIAAMLVDGADLSELPGIGEDLAKKIEEIVKTGTFADLGKIETRLPHHLADLAVLPGLGPRRVKTLYESLGVKSLVDLRRAATAGKIAALPRFGAKMQTRILDAIRQLQTAEKRIKLADAEEIAVSLTSYLSESEDLKNVTVAGSFRRRRETVGDLDIVATCKASTEFMDRFVHYEDVADVISKGKTRSTIRLRSGLQVDLRVVPEESYGAALHYFTGSKEHNIALRSIAAEKGWKLNEYGLFQGNKRLAGKTEKEIYAKFRLPFIEPELRENRGEIEAARTGALPHLITLEDMRGDLHVHTVETDGQDTIERMAEAAKERGYGYIAIADHTKHLTIARGMDEKRLARQIREIDQLNGKMRGFRVLKAAEVDILEDGSLDLPDRILRELDLVICAVHYKFDLPEARQTERVLRAMDNPYFSILAHPSGRLMGEREACNLDMPRVIAGAAERGCFLEVNGQPERMDLNDIHCRMAKELGVKLVISTDAHSVATLDYMRFGISQARRGWLEAGEVLNTRSLQELERILKARQSQHA